MELNNLLSAYQIAKNKEGNLVEDPRIAELDNQVQEEVPQMNNADEVNRLETMMGQLDPANQEPEYMKELGKERDIMQEEQYAQDDQSALDTMKFSDAFSQHYDKVKDIPVSERPKLVWRGREYAPIKADEPEEIKQEVMGPSEATVKASKEESSYKDILGQRESSNDYQAENSLGYIGKYQMGGMALQDLGLKDKQGNWTGKDGINSKEDFLNNPEVQEKTMDEWVNIQNKYLKSAGADKYIGTKFDGVNVTKEGLSAAAHLVGAKAVAKMLQTGKIPQDANGVKATEYMKMFSK